MSTATITDAKNGLSALIDRVKAGETIVILDRGVPVARLEPVTALTDPEGHLRQLERQGLIRRGTGKLPPGFLKLPLPTSTGGMTLTEALLEERRTGR
jgi:prevent-host-death family protein